MEENKPENNQWRPVQIQTILVPTDLRLESMVAFQYALYFGQAFRCQSHAPRRFRGIVFL
jgi:hypothetical protein